MICFCNNSVNVYLINDNTSETTMYSTRYECLQIITTSSSELSPHQEEYNSTDHKQTFLSV